MSSRELQAKFKRSMYWQQMGAEFTSSDAQRVMSTGRKTDMIDLTRAQQVLLEMQQSGDIVKVSQHRYIRRADNRKWLGIKWRTKANGECGFRNGGIGIQ
jgi:hypothetical protein